jgi:hypothetical protein
MSKKSRQPEPQCRERIEDEQRGRRRGRSCECRWKLERFPALRFGAWCQLRVSDIELRLGKFEDQEEESSARKEVESGSDAMGIPIQTL